MIVHKGKSQIELVYIVNRNKEAKRQELEIWLFNGHQRIKEE